MDIMEVKINKEIRNYTESMFFGLSLRQCIFSFLAVGVAVGIFFGCRNHIGTESVSWICIIGAAPFAAMGFITYHGMTAEQFAWAWFKSEVIMPKRLTFNPTNIYYEAVRLFRSNSKSLSKQSQDEKGRNYNFISKNMMQREKSKKGAKKIAENT